MTMTHTLFSLVWVPVPATSDSLWDNCYPSTGFLAHPEGASILRGLAVWTKVRVLGFRAGWV